VNESIESLTDGHWRMEARVQTAALDAGNIYGYDALLALLQSIRYPHRPVDIGYTHDEHWEKLRVALRAVVAAKPISVRTGGDGE
jgi:hypothetical protein